MKEVINIYVKFTTQLSITMEYIYRSNYRNLILIKKKLLIKLGFQILKRIKLKLISITYLGNIILV